MSFHPAMPYGTAEWHRSQRVTLPEGPEFAFTAENRQRFEEFAAHYTPEQRKSAVLHALYLVQDQQGYITGNAARHVADVIGMTTADVEDVVSYYVMFFRNPVGKFVLQVCTTLSCAAAGAERVVEELEHKLGIKAGQTDPTGMFTIQPMECLGACDRAPVMMVNNIHWHENLRPEQAPALVDAIKAKGVEALNGCHLAIEGRPESEWKHKTTTPVKPKAMPDYEPVLTKYAFTPGGNTLDHYLKHQQGYEGLKKALAMTPDQVIDAVKASGLRGRGGAGFPTGLKWQFVDKKSPKAKYIVCNADESEPGTFKDHLLMERNPHLLIEGCLIGCYAIASKAAYIYIRGEFFHMQHILENEIEEARKAGYLGKNILGSGFDCEVYVHRGAGAYEAGEETALLESLEGKRAQPRFKPPFPAVAGAWGCPTAVNNVETLCNVPLVMTRGAEWFASLGPEKNGGPKLFCVSGHVKNPGVFEAPMKVSLRELIDELRRRHARRPHDEGGHPRRLVGADPDARSDRHPGELRRHREGRVAAGLGGDHGARRHHRHGLAGREPAPLLPPRVVRQVHALPRRHRLAVSFAAPADARAKARPRTSRCCRAWPTTSTARRCAPSAMPRRRRC